MIARPLTFVVMTLVAAAAIAETTATQGQTRPTGTGAISGAVTDAATGQPVAGALVQISGGAGLYLGQTGTLQLTDAQGRFVFRALPVGKNFTLSATQAGLIDGQYGQLVPFGPAGRIALAEGEWFSRAAIRMWRPAAISGRVVDERGEPVVGSYVRVLAQQPIAGGTRLLAGAATKTDDRGEYRIAGLLPARYLVLVPSVQMTVPYGMTLVSRDSASQLENQALSANIRGVTPRTDAPVNLDPTQRLLVGNFVTPPPPLNGRPQTYPITFYPGATSIDSATAVELAAGAERRGVDIALRPVPAVRVAGSVEGAVDQIAGLPVRLMAAGLENLGPGSETAISAVGADGRFVFLNVPAGNYTIDTGFTATWLRLQSAAQNVVLPAPPGMPALNGPGGALSQPGAEFHSFSASRPDPLWGRRSIAVGATDVDVVVPMVPSVTLRGRLIFEGSSRVVATTVTAGGLAGGTSPVMIAERPPLPTIMPNVYAEPATPDGSLAAFQSNSPAAEGDTDTFVLSGLRPGDYVLRVRSGTGRYIVKSIVAGGRDVTNGPITIAAGGNLSDVVVTFTTDVPVLEGTIQKSGDLDPLSAVILFPVEREQWTRFGLTPTRLLSQPIGGGAFRFDAVPAGEYFVIAVGFVHAEAWRDPAFLAKAAGAATRVRIGWGETRSVNLTMSVIR